MTAPSASAIAATTEVLELASLLDHRVPTPDKARVMAWSRQIDRHGLPRDDMLNAVQEFYDRPSPDPISVGDVIDGARRIKRNRLDREDEHQREQRQLRLDRKAADEVRAITTAVVMGPSPRTDRIEAAELALQCCTTKTEAQQAICEYFAAKTDARKAPA